VRLSDAGGVFTDVPCGARYRGIGDALISTYPCQELTNRRTRLNGVLFFLGSVVFFLFSFGEVSVGLRLQAGPPSHSFRPG
jgi:hypothetical protein